MESRFVLDTNIVLYLLGGRLAEPLQEAEYFVSVITELELLSYPNLSVEEESSIRALLADVAIVELDAEIKSETVRIRRELNLGLPDSIICATAKTLGAQLLSNEQSLVRVPTLRVRQLGLR